MLSQLGPLFKTTFRQAEPNDTRQHIPHEEKEDPQRKKDNQPKAQSNNDFWEDNTSVSVDALRVFLIDFIKTIPEAKDMEFVTNKEQIQNKRPHEKSRPKNTHNAKAVRAYQTMAEHAAPPPPLDEGETHNNNDPTADKIQSQELRDIYTLIQDLEFLSKRGVQNLNIEKAQSFVESLKNAVAKKLNR